MHSSTITDHVAKENHTIVWEGAKFPVRDTDWTARGAKEAVKIRKHEPTPRTGMGMPPTIIIVLQVADEEDVAICNKQCSMSALMMPIDIVHRN